MNRKITVRTLCAVLFAVCSSAQAQPTGKVARVGFLDASTESGNAVLMQPLRQELSKLGWTEGKNIAFEYRFAEGQPERQNDLAAELVRLKLDLIVVAGTGPALAAKRPTATKPKVMASAGDPVAAGLVASLARPGGNVTGFSALATHQEVGGTQGRGSQALTSWTSDSGERPLTGVYETYGSGTEAEIGSARDSTRSQRFRARLSNC